MAQARTRAHRWILGYVCHEMRNPVHVLKAALSLLGSTREAAGTAVDAEALSDARAAVRHLERAVDDTLDFRRCGSASGLPVSMLSPRRGLLPAMAL